MIWFRNKRAEIKGFFNFDVVIEFGFPPPSIGESFELKDKYLWQSIEINFPFAFSEGLALGAIIIIGNGFFLQEILYHFFEFSSVSRAKIQCHIPDVIEGNRLMSTFGANNPGKNLSTEIIANYWILSLLVVSPPLLTLCDKKQVRFIQEYF